MSIIIPATVYDNELPTDGQHLAVLADIVEEKQVASAFGVVDIVRFYWLLDQLGTKKFNLGQHLEISQMLNQSMGDKANLRKTIRGIIGYDPGNFSYDVEPLLGSNALLFLTTKTSNEGREYAKVEVVAKVPAGTAKLVVPATYVRRQNRPKFGKPTAKTATNSTDLSGI